MNITAEYLREIFSYDPDEGVLRWKHSTVHHRKGGESAGTWSGSAANRYLSVFVKRRAYKVHRVIWCMMTGEWPKGVVDHKDGDTGNNRWTNLRECTQAENCRNQRRGGANTSGLKGAHRSGNRWIAQICVNYEKIYLGTFDTAEQAHAAYAAAAAKYHGDFARAA